MAFDPAHMLRAGRGLASRLRNQAKRAHTDTIKRDLELDAALVAHICLRYEISAAEVVKLNAKIDKIRAEREQLRMPLPEEKRYP